MKELKHTKNKFTQTIGAIFEESNVRQMKTRMNIIIIAMKKMEAGLERPLYPRNRCRIRHKYLLQNIIVNYGFRCYGDQRYNHTALPDQNRTYLDGF